MLVFVEADSRAVEEVAASLFRSLTGLDKPPCFGGRYERRPGCDSVHVGDSWRRFLHVALHPILHVGATL